MGEDHRPAITPKHRHHQSQLMDAPAPRTTNAVPTYTAPLRIGLLSDPRLRGRGNGPVRRALIQRLQQTQGNRATSRLLRRALAHTPVPPRPPAGRAPVGNTLPPAPPVQRAIRIGKSKVKPPFTTWAAFEESIPPPFKDGLLKHKAAIEKLLSAPYDEEQNPPHTFGSYKELLDFLNGGGGGSKEKSSESAKMASVPEEHPVLRIDDPGSAAQRLLTAKFTLFEELDSLEQLIVLLTKGVHVVVCADDKIKIPDLQSKVGPLAKSIVFLPSCTRLDFVVTWLAVKHGVVICPAPGAVGSWLVGKEYVLPQSPQMRGDMHDVLPAFALDPNMKVAVCFAQSIRFRDADVILGYYSAYKGRVVICPFEGSKLSSLEERVKRVTWATEILVQAVEKNPVGARRLITEETTGYPTKEDDERYAAECKRLGFVPGMPYLIVNYRDSGHKPGKGREASHPELDTGTAGFLQIMDAAQELGFVPVPMGQPPGMTKDSWNGPHLIEYWLFDSCKATPLRNKRQAEYGLLRYLAEHFNIRAFAMRSGGTDAMVYAGIETISLDLAASGAKKGELAAAKLASKFQEAGNRSWMRAAVRDLIMPGKFHQGFFQHPRPEMEEKEEKGTDWKGAFAEDDVYHTHRRFISFSARRKRPSAACLNWRPIAPWRSRSHSPSGWNRRRIDPIS